MPFAVPMQDDTGLWLTNDNLGIWREQCACWRTVNDVVTTANWGRLRHAYGWATDTRGHLAALESGNAEAREAALDQFDIALLRQGFPETATAPVVRAVTALLADRRAHPDRLEALLEFLGDGAMSVTDLADDRYFAEMLPDLADAVAQAYPVVLPLLTPSPPDRALFRAENLVAIARIPSLADRREELAALVLEWSERGAGPQAEWLGCLGQLGADLRSWLTDPDRRSGSGPRRPTTTIRAAVS
ncbi:hypothetical protein ABTX15_32115 [Micromonospora sp. NPDC094482]|uniref:hypothetical protein n=1 Tax=unclassified Micromonospora TaxID=2617518 RepID=UPI00332F28FD